MRIRARQRRDVDDVAAAALFHLRNSFVTAVENAEEICFQHRAKIFRRRLFNGLEDADASVVDEDVETAEVFDGVVDQSFHLSMVTDVANETTCRDSQFFDRFISLALAARRDANRDALADQGFSDRATDASRAARDDCSFVLEVHLLMRLRRLMCGKALPFRLRLPKSSRSFLRGVASKEREKTKG